MEQVLDQVVCCLLGGWVMANIMSYGRITVLGFLVAMSCVGPPASSNTNITAAFHRDGDGTKGRLDIVSSRRSTRGAKTSHEVIIERAWANTLLKRRENWIGVGISTDGDVSWERFIWIRYRPRAGLVAPMFKNNPEYPVKVKNVAVWRSSDRAVRVAFRPRVLGDNAGKYRWFVASSFQTHKDGPCKEPGYEIDDAFPPEGSCHDRAPGGDHYYRR
jgi:hypothetical protein